MSISDTPVIRTQGDTLFPTQGIVRIDGNQLDLLALGIAATPQIVDQDDPENVIESGDAGVTIQPSHTFTVVVDSNRVTRVAHTVKECDQVELAGTGTLPAGLITGQRYFVVNPKTNSFQLSLEPDGLPVVIEGTGTGVHSFMIPGEIRYDFQAADVADVGEYWFHFLLARDGETQHVTFPLHVVD